MVEIKSKILKAVKIFRFLSNGIFSDTGSTKNNRSGLQFNDMYSSFFLIETIVEKNGLKNATYIAIFSFSNGIVKRHDMMVKELNRIATEPQTKPFPAIFSIKNFNE